MPDEILDTRILIACIIHDLNYIFDENRKKSDKRLMRNIRIIANKNYKFNTRNKSWRRFGDWDDLLESRARRRAVYGVARVYYAAVRAGGESAWEEGHKLQ